jgi:hypothetical protein
MHPCACVLKGKHEKDFGFTEFDGVGGGDERGSCDPSICRYNVIDDVGEQWFERR